MSITPNEARDRFAVRCDRCAHEIGLAGGDLTAGGIRERGWLPVGHNEHSCPSCVRAQAAARRVGEAVAAQ